MDIPVPNEEICVVYYDLETGGLQKTADILQIAAKCGNYSFSAYITPTQQISFKASDVNGLTSVDRNLLLNGNPVSSKPLQIVFQEFLIFLSRLQRRCVLCAHNGNTFDTPRLMRAINMLGMTQQFKIVIRGFGDTLPIVRRINGPRRNGLTQLASSLRISTAGAHNAIKDVEILEQIVENFGIPEEEIIRTSEDWESCLEKEIRAEILRTPIPLNRYVSNGTREKMAATDIIHDLVLLLLLLVIVLCGYLGLMKWSDSRYKVLM